MLQEFDFLIAFSISTTVPDLIVNNKFPSKVKENLQKVHNKKIIEIDWMAYDIKNQITTDDAQYFVKPLQASHFNQETLDSTRVPLQKIQQGQNLFDVIQTFNDFIYTKFTRNNLSFCLVTFGDEVMTKILPQEAINNQIKLASHFQQYFDIGYEFRKFCPQAIYMKSMDEMLKYLNLGENTAMTTCQYECKSTVRLVNVLVRGNHVFSTPKLLNIQHQIQPEIKVEETGVIQLQDNKKYSFFIRGKQPDPFRNPMKQFFLRIRGLPNNAREAEVMEFLRNLRVYKENITFLYDSQGKFTGEAYVKLVNESDLREAVSYSGGTLQGKGIECFETNEIEYSKAKKSQFPDQREIPDFSQNQELYNFVTEQMGFIKMIGLPFSCTDQDIIQFFRGLKIVQNGIKRAIIGGKPSSECFVIFETIDMAQQAMSLHMEKIGQRFIELSVQTMRDFENFIHHNFINTAPNYSRDHMPNIPSEKKRSTIMVFNLPFTTDKVSLMDFFKEYMLNDREIHLLTSHSGKFSGNALVTFEDELEAQRALKSKNLKMVGNKYVELYEFK